MTHQRIRPYEHKLSHNGEDFEYELAMAVRAGNRIWVRGQTGLDLDGNPITPESEDRYLYITQTLKDWMTNQASEERARAALAYEDAPPVNSTAPAPSWATGGADEPTATPAPASVGNGVSSLRERLERHR